MKQPGLGDVVGEKYVLESIIGRGGFATVYRARDIRIDRTVAMKVLTPGENGYPLTTASRFQREARALASLNDAHTIRMFDYGRTAHGVLFMVFELLKGLDLSQHLSVVKTMNEADTCHVIEQLLSSLREAHAVGILHRDIKPGNIRIYEYMDDPLRAKLMDFGIVRLMDPQAESLTGTGFVVGTILYMSPEQARGEELKPASDIFTLGLVAHEMLTGDQRPAMEVISGPLDVPVSAGFQRVLEKMLAADSRDRYQNANEVLEAIAVARAAGPWQGEDEYAPTQEQSLAESYAAFGGSPPPASRSSQSTAAQDEPDRPAVSLGAVAALAILCFGVGLGAVLMFGSRGGDDASVETSRELGGLVKSKGAGLQVEPIDSLPPDDVRTASIDAGAAGDAASSSSGCGKVATDVGEMRRLSVVEGLRRLNWDAYLPKGYDPNTPHPMVVIFHADASNIREALRSQDLRSFADEKKFIIIGPSQEGITAYRAGVDPDMIEQMVDATREQYCVDPDRIFAFGVGGGGGGVESVSCEPWVAATATTSWRYQTSMRMCPGKRPVPTLYFAQLRSKYLPVKGGVACAGYEKLVSLKEHEERVRARNGCRGPERTTSTYKGSNCVTWDCKVPFVSCRIDGGHTWVGHKRSVDVIGCDGPPAEFPHNETMWEFFEQVTADTPRPADR